MINGTYYFGRKRVACRNAYCTTCRASAFAEGRRSLIVLHVYFIPLLPLGTTVRWFCTTCQNETDARRPSRTWILIAGVFFGLLMAFVGVMMLIEGAEKEPALGCLIIGPLMIAGLIHMIRRRDYSDYIASRQAVAPLRADRCPYCSSSVFATRKPRCHACKVDIMT